MAEALDQVNVLCLGTKPRFQIHKKRTLTIMVPPLLSNQSKGVPRAPEEKRELHRALSKQLHVHSCGGKAEQLWATS